MSINRIEIKQKIITCLTIGSSTIKHCKVNIKENYASGLHLESKTVKMRQDLNKNQISPVMAGNI